MIKLFNSIYMWFIKKLNLYTQEEIDNINHEHGKVFQNINAQLNDERDKVRELEVKLVAIGNQCKDMEATLQKVMGAKDDCDKEIERLKSLCQRYCNADSENLEMLKEIQKCLSEEFHKSVEFKFPRSHPIPGSTSIRTGQIDPCVDHDGKIILRGRSIMMDQDTVQISNIPDMYGRLMYIIQYMERYGILTRIAKDLILNSAASLVLTYNDNCTNYELYYEIVTDSKDRNTMFTVTENGLEQNKQ